MARVARAFLVMALAACGSGEEYCIADGERARVECTVATPGGREVYAEREYEHHGEGLLCFTVSEYETPWDERCVVHIEEDPDGLTIAVE